MELSNNPAALYQEGFRSVSDIKQHLDLLTEEQRNVFSYFDEMEAAFSRDEAEEIVKVVKENLESLFDGAQDIFDIEACGAYRRGEAELKDLDLLITRNDDGSTVHVLMKLVEHLEERGLILQQLKEVRVSSSGSAGFQGIIRLGNDKKCHRIDINCYPLRQKPFALLYFTGPPNFNQWLRKQAAERGYSLSDSGMQINRNYDVPHEQEMRLKAFEPLKSEEDVFKVLELEYVVPNMRSIAPIPPEELY
ncbi:hypothetical protein FGO68_gene5814 [Halteria grandinella]|uniref:DNA polymerase n=1 Tax=Halteria grandinella TaxID=5974 RepID=A0A8J8ND84_HALGN|nr:hypothetical protein FGO68_gene5814 [Halteria grandinella]